MIASAIASNCNPHYPSTAPLLPMGSQRRHSVSGIPSKLTYTHTFTFRLY